jgi:hypothetical protein
MALPTIAGGLAAYGAGAAGAAYLGGATAFGAAKTGLGAAVGGGLYLAKATYDAIQPSTFELQTQAQKLKNKQQAAYFDAARWMRQNGQRVKSSSLRRDGLARGAEVTERDVRRPLADYERLFNTRTVANDLREKKNFHDPIVRPKRVLPEDVSHNERPINQQVTVPPVGGTRDQFQHWVGRNAFKFDATRDLQDTVKTPKPDIRFPQFIGGHPIKRRVERYINDIGKPSHEFTRLPDHLKENGLFPRQVLSQASFEHAQDLNRHLGQVLVKHQRSANDLFFKELDRPPVQKGMYQAVNSEEKGFRTEISELAADRRHAQRFLNDQLPEKTTGKSHEEHFLPTEDADEGRKRRRVSRSMQYLAHMQKHYSGSDGPISKDQAVMGAPRNLHG